MEDRLHTGPRRARGVLLAALLAAVLSLSGTDGPRTGRDSADSVAVVYAAEPRPDPALTRLHREIARLAARAGGTVGVMALHLESGRAVAVNATERFPMASAYKIPIAVQLLTLVDQRKVSLLMPIQLRKSDLRPGSGTLRLSYQPGLTVTVGRLLDGMLTESDNTAADLLIRVAGGPGAVTDRMRQLGLTQIYVNRPTFALLTDEAGVVLSPLPDESPVVTYNRAMRRVTREQKAAAAARFAADPRDTATPAAIVRLLALVRNGTALSPASTDLLLGLMRRCETGESRLRRLLPAGTSVPHKTGTLGPVRIDVGYIELPDGAGTVAVAVFVRSTANSARSLRVIGEIGRALYDFFLLVPARA